MVVLAISATRTGTLLPKNLTGVLCALGAWFMFSLNDIGIKYLSGDYALHQIVLIRALTGMAFTLAVFVPMEGGLSVLKTSRPVMHLIRGFCVVCANLAFFTGLATISLPEASAIFFIAPLIITALSAIFLGEPVGPRRWFAVMIGFIGVLVMLRPGSEAFRVAALLPLFAAAAYATLQVLTRSMGVTEKASTMSFYIQLVFVVVCALTGLLVGDGQYAPGNNPSLDFLLRQWQWPLLSDFAIMIGLGLSSGLGGYLISQAYRVSEATVIAPFEYLALILAIFWGITLFDEWPDLAAWIGIALILFSGLYVFWREVVLDRQFVIKHPMPRNR